MHYFDYYVVEGADIIDEMVDLEVDIDLGLVRSNDFEKALGIVDSPIHYNYLVR